MQGERERKSFPVTLRERLLILVILYSSPPHSSLCLSNRQPCSLLDFDKFICCIMYYLSLFFKKKNQTKVINYAHIHTDHINCLLQCQTLSLCLYCYSKKLPCPLFLLWIFYLFYKIVYPLSSFLICLQNCLPPTFFPYLSTKVSTPFLFSTLIFLEIV